MTDKEILDAMRSMLEPINNRLDKMDERFDKMDERSDKMDTQLDNMDNRMLKIELTQENIIIPRIQLLAEGHSEVVNKLRGLDELTERVEDIQNTVDVLKHIVVKK